MKRNVVWHVRKMGTSILYDSIRDNCVDMSSSCCNHIYWQNLFRIFLCYVVTLSDTLILSWTKEKNLEHCFTHRVRREKCEGWNWKGNFHFGPTWNHRLGDNEGGMKLIKRWQLRLILAMGRFEWKILRKNRINDPIFLLCRLKKRDKKTLMPKIIQKRFKI